MKIYDNYIFDFDGTLMDTSGVIMATIRATIRQMGLPERSEAQCRAIIGIRTDDAGRYLYPGTDISNREFARAFRQNYDCIKRNAHEELFPGVNDTLMRLLDSGHGIAIASSRRLDSLYDYLDGLGIRACFSAIIGADSVNHGKPDPEPVLKVLETLRWKPEHTLVVGDADVDIMMGNAAGCHTCAVTYGNGSLASLKRANPTYIIDRFTELI